MDTLLCDELLQEIFHRLLPSSSAAVSLFPGGGSVSSDSPPPLFSLNFPSPYNPTTITSYSTFLSHHPFLSSVSLTGGSCDGGDPLLLAVATSCPNLRQLRFLSSPVSPFSLYTLSASCIHLSSIAVSISRPLSFDWLRCFNSLKSLSLFLAGPSTQFYNLGTGETKDAVLDWGLSLESLTLCGVSYGDYEISFLWRNCKNVKKLSLKSCQSVGDYNSFSRFLNNNNLQELELRICRAIADGVLLKLAENCASLDSLLVYDGGSKEGLLQFINQSNCNLRRLSLRLPLDLDNAHLIDLAHNLNFRTLMSLRLESCCLVTGEGLKSVARAMGNGLEELALVNCDVMERESGLLTALGQDLKRLRKLDLSNNDMLVDKELVSMLVSCNSLEELRLRGCSRLSNACVDSIVRSCRKLQCVDVVSCCGIEVEGVELLVINLLFLKRVEVEQSKLSQVARAAALNKSVEVVS